MRRLIMTVLLLSPQLAQLAWAQSPTTAPAGAAQSATAMDLSVLFDAVKAYLIPLAASSALTVALLEAFKKLFSIRGRFHRAAVIQWLSQKETAVPKALQGALSPALRALHGNGNYGVRAELEVSSPKSSKEPYSPDRAYAEFFHLTSGQSEPTELKPRADWFHWRGIDRAVFELEIARMMSQIQDAADATLNNPAMYQHLYLFFTRGSSPEDVEAWSDYMSSGMAAEPDKKQAERYGRIRLLVRRQLDAFQGVTSSRWDELNQFWAIVVGAVILLIAQLMTADPTAPGLSGPLVSIAMGWHAAWQGEHPSITAILLRSLLGGVLAPVAKDILNAIANIRLK